MFNYKFQYIYHTRNNLLFFKNKLYSSKNNIYRLSIISGMYFCIDYRCNLFIKRYITAYSVAFGIINIPFIN